MMKFQFLARTICVIASLSRTSRAALHPGECPSIFQSPLQPQVRATCPTPIDEDVGSDSTNWAPWTHRPYCIRSTRSPGTKYCVYTNTFHGENGLSIITTPETAAMSADVFDDPYGLSFITTGFVGNGSEASSFRISDVPGKGKGVIATRVIRAYETIMVDHATVLADIGFPSSVMKSQGHELLHIATDRLSAPETVLTLGRSSTSGADIVEDILRTNAFHQDLAGEPHMALYPEISRINHACKPNAFTRFLPGSLSVTIVAFRDIQPGEEITISYTPLGQTFEDRQEALKRWGFTCSCDFCTAPSEQIIESDFRRTRVEKLRGDTLEAVKKGKMHTAIRICHEILDLLRIEELTSLMPEQLEIIARLYWKMQDRKNAEKYAREALEILRQHTFLDAQNQERDLRRLLQAFDS